MTFSRERIAVLATGLLVAFLALPARAPGDLLPKIVNGLPTHDYPTTGTLLYAPTGDVSSAGLMCTGTLIGCNTFLTAAHCVEGDSTVGNYFVFLQHAGIFAATSVTYHSDYSFPRADVAVLKLAGQVTGIDPTEINLTDPTPMIPHTAIIAGYGQSLGDAGDYGIKRFGRVITADCGQIGTEDGGSVGNVELVCWNYASPAGNPGEDSNTCNGDSGGPLFMDLGAGQVVAGITSGGALGSCDVGDSSFDVNVYHYQNFIQTQLGSDQTSTCGGLPPVGGAGVVVLGNSGQFTSVPASAAFTVPVSSGVNALRIVINSEDNRILDTRMYVKYGSAASTSDYDCKADGVSPFGACTFASPQAGNYYVLIEATGGSGSYQATSTIFGGDPPECGNGVREFGEGCDGSDDSDCPGSCQADCSCPAPVCGNGVREAGEVCDGSDAAACPTGTCEADCSCPAPVCGNNIIEQGEVCDGSDAAACPGNCGAPGSATECACPSACGDGTCDSDEDADNCAADCGCGAPGVCGDQAPGECWCDQVCVDFEDCCSDACDVCGFCGGPTDDCGNGTIEVGEDCDDGNTADGACCSSTCTFESTATACSGTNLCTSGGQCDGAGSCVVTAQPASGCSTAGRSVFKVIDRPGQSKDQLKWTWKKGQALSIDDLGSPNWNTDYALCVYDSSGGQASLATSLELPANAFWIYKGARGWVYKDSSAYTAGIQRLLFKTGSAGRAKALLKAKGENLPMPERAEATRMFSMDPNVTVQVVNDEGHCWTSEFSTARRNNATKFKAKAP